MTRYVLDASTLVRLVSDDLSVDPDHQLVAPAWIRSAALQLLLDDVRRGVREAADVRPLHDRMTETRIRVLGDRVSRWSAWQLALEQGWTDLRAAEYVALVRLQADALVTVDEDVRDRARSLVPVEPITVLRAGS